MCVCMCVYVCVCVCATGFRGLVPLTLGEIVINLGVLIGGRHRHIEGGDGESLGLTGGSAVVGGPGVLSGDGDEG